MTLNLYEKKFGNIFYIIMTSLFILVFDPSHASESFYQNNKLLENSSIKITDVVKFQFKKIDPLDKKNLNISLKTKNQFKIYEDKLKFKLIPHNTLSYDLSYSPSKPAYEYFDPFYKENKKIYQSGVTFLLNNYKDFSPNDKIEIEVQSCSNSICLVPTKLTLTLTEGAIAEEIKENSVFNQSKTNQSLSFSSENPLKDDKQTASNISSSEKITILNDNIALKIQQALSLGSFILFPALFLAGLLMNLTPCVYPMIPITLNVMAQFGVGTKQSEKKNNKNTKFLPFIYVGGMVLTYTLLGVFAGMTGNVFGSQLASPIFNWIIATIMLILGISMLGFFNLSSLQNFAHKIPLAQNYPHLAVGTMGAVSGLVSAPCTGPVLSMILVLIAQNKNPITGFTYMFFFALGFGLPYLILGFFGQKISRLPRFPKIINFTKIFFASLMFALALYYLRNSIQNIPGIQLLFTKPKLLTVAILIMVSILFSLLFVRKNTIGKISTLGLTISCCLLALWLTLATTNSFMNFNNLITEENFDKENSIHWYKDFDQAKELAKKTQKPILFDVWADWCTACLEMKETTWKEKDLVDYINKNYIAVQLDYTNIPDNLQVLINRWGVAGLPAIGFFRNNSSFDEKPDTLFQGLITTHKIIETAKNISSEK